MWGSRRCLRGHALRIAFFRDVIVQAHQRVAAVRGQPVPFPVQGGERLLRGLGQARACACFFLVSSITASAPSHARPAFSSRAAATASCCGAARRPPARRPLARRERGTGPGSGPATPASSTSAGRGSRPRPGRSTCGYEPSSKIDQPVCPPADRTPCRSRWRSPAGAGRRPHLRELPGLLIDAGVTGQHLPGTGGIHDEAAGVRADETPQPPFRRAAAVGAGRTPATWFRPRAGATNPATWP